MTSVDTGKCNCPKRLTPVLNGLGKNGVNGVTVNQYCNAMRHVFPDKIGN